jgi:hypothetical protein
MCSEIAKEWAAEDRAGARDQEFSEWCDKLEVIMRAWDVKHGNLPYELPLDRDAGWRDCFNDDMTPQEAFDSDQSYWEE